MVLYIHISFINIFPNGFCNSFVPEITVLAYYKLYHTINHINKAIMDRNSGIGSCTSLPLVKLLSIPIPFNL